MTRWFGHKDTESKILNPAIPDALRDAILLDQIDRVGVILEEMGFSRRPVPNGLLFVGTDIDVPPGSSVQITARPQRESFDPIYFISLSRRFIVNEIRIGNRSQFIQTHNVASEVFLAPCDLDFTCFRVMPGNNYSGELNITMTPEEAQRLVLPDACSAFDWETCYTAMDVVVIATNVSDMPQKFEAFILGKSPRRNAPRTFEMPQ